MGQITEGLIAVVVGVFGVMALFWILNFAVERLPRRLEAALKPYVFIGPALAVVGLFLVFPGVLTIRDSFYDARGDNFVGADNYANMAGDPAIRSLLLNNLIWIIIVPSLALAIGLGVAVLADRLKPRWENVTKSLIFLPMAISFIGAATIWNFIYALRPPGRPQIGLLNAIWTSFGFDPVWWLNISSYRLNTVLLTIVVVWLQAGFAMVLLSAAIKSVPTETLEAARIDGAKETQIFWRVIMPQIKSTIFVVLTTIIITVMKIFDVVFAMTNGRADTDVVARRFYQELFVFRNQGNAAVLVVVLMLAVVPIMFANVRRFRQEEALR